MSTSRWIRAAVTAVTVAAGGLAVAAAPAQAADYPTSKYYVPYTNTYTQGELTWYNRGVGYSGTVRVTARSCRYTRVETLNAAGKVITNYNNNDFHCNLTYTDTLEQLDAGVAPADVPGGAAAVRVCLIGSPADPQDYNTLGCSTRERP